MEIFFFMVFSFIGRVGISVVRGGLGFCFEGVFVRLVFF